MTVSQYTSAPLILVVGSTGIQGGSVIKALSQSDRAYRIRGITRDVNKDAAQGLVKQGVEMVSVALDNREQVYDAFKGATYVFGDKLRSASEYTQGMTNYWQDPNKEREVAEGKLLVDAAQVANVKLFVWAGLVSWTDISKGRYVHVDHFESKADVTRYAKERGIPFSNVIPGCYMQNFLGKFRPVKASDGSFVFAYPVRADATIPLIDAVEDYGLFVREAIEAPEFGPGSEIYAFSELVTFAKIGKQISEVTGKTVVYKPLTDGEFKESALRAYRNEAVVIGLFEEFRGIEEFGYFGDANLEASLKHLARAPRTWAEFVKTTDWSQVLL